MTLSEFLLARIAEDEAVARDAAALAETPWRATYGRQVETARDGYLVTPEDEHSYSDDPTDAVSQHIARHDPARVLAECEAKRQIVALHKPSDEYDLQACVLCQWDIDCDAPKHDHQDGAGEWPCPTIRLLALPYADHPDYQDEWRP